MSWRVTTLRAVAEVALGRQRAPQHESGLHIVPYLRAANVKNGSLDLSDVLEMNFTPKEQQIFALQPGDVLVTEGSGSRSVVGASAVWRGEIGGTICFQNTLLRFRPRPGVMDGRFLAWWARGARDSGLFASIAGGANIYHLSAERVRQLPLNLPPIEEQRRIADFLDAELGRLDTIGNARKRQRGVLAERWTATVYQLVTRGTEFQAHLRETGNPTIPAVPASWQVLPLKRRWQIIDCKHRTPTYVTTGYPVVSPGDITPGRLNLRMAHRFVDEQDFRDLADDLRRPRRGDIVYSRNASVGIAAYVDTDEPFTMGQDVCRITSRNQSQLYLTHFLNSVATPQLEQMQIGSTFSRVNIGALLELQVPCPPPREQKAIAARLDEEHRQHHALECSLVDQLGLLAERRQALITAAATGQIDVTTARGAAT